MKLPKLSELQNEIHEVTVILKGENSNFGNFGSFAHYMRMRVRKYSNLVKKLEKV